MVKTPVTKQTVDDAVADILEAAEQMRMEYLQHISEARARDAETLLHEKEELEKRLGADHPRVRAMERARRSVNYLTQFSTTTRGHAEYCGDETDEQKYYNRDYSAMNKEEEDS